MSLLLESRCLSVPARRGKDACSISENLNRPGAGCPGSGCLPGIFRSGYPDANRPGLYRGCQNDRSRINPKRPCCNSSLDPTSADGGTTAFYQHTSPNTNPCPDTATAHSPNPANCHTSAGRLAGLPGEVFV